MLEHNILALSILQTIQLPGQGEPQSAPLIVPYVGLQQHPPDMSFPDISFGIANGQINMSKQQTISALSNIVLIVWFSR